MEEIEKIREIERAEPEKIREKTRLKREKEKVEEFFEFSGSSPYMLIVADVKQKLRREMTEEEQKNIIGNLQNDFERRAEERIKGEIILKKVAEAESLTVDDNEVYDRMKKMAEDTRRSYEEIENFYKEYNMMDNLRASILEEKTLTFLRENAVVKVKQ